MDTEEKQEFEAKYSVKIPDVSKEGSLVRFRLLIHFTESGRNRASTTGSVEDTSTVLIRLRDFGDFEFLSHQLHQEVARSGVIYPPLPPSPYTDQKTADQHLKELYGADSKQLKGDNYKVVCTQLENFLDYLLQHPRFGDCKCLASFLEDAEAPARPEKVPNTVGAGAKMVKMISNLAKSGKQEADTARLTKNLQSARAVYKSFINLSQQQLRLASVLGSFNGESTDTNLEIMSPFTDALEDQARILDVSAEAACSGLGASLEMSCRILDAILDAFQRRDALAAEYQEATKAVAKTKPGPKKVIAEEKQAELEMAYQNCCAELRLESEMAQAWRIRKLSFAINKWTQLQVTASIDQRALLHNAIKKLSA